MGEAAKDEVNFGGMRQRYDEVKAVKNQLLCVFSFSSFAVSWIYIIYNIRSKICVCLHC